MTHSIRTVQVSVASGTEYLRSLGIACSDDVPPAPHRLVFHRVYHCWNRLFEYWLDAPRASKTAAWVSKIEVDLYIVCMFGSMEKLQTIVTPRLIERARKARRRKDTSMIPIEVAEELRTLLY